MNQKAGTPEDGNGMRKEQEVRPDEEKAMDSVQEFHWKRAAAAVVHAACPELHNPCPAVVQG